MNDKIKFMIILAISLAIVLLAINLLQNSVPKNQPKVSEALKKFNSSDELKNFLKTNLQEEGYGGYFSDSLRVKASNAPTAGAAMAEYSGASEYSTTNIQVEGVDESDIVKNDGKYIYTVSGNKVVIVDAYPAENMKIVSEINLNRSVGGIFINGNKLIIFAQGFEYYNYGLKEVARCLGGRCPLYGESQSLVYVYDTADKSNPTLEKNISIQGNYKDSRMIGDYVYVISQKSANVGMPEPPVYVLNGEENKVMASDVYYFDYSDSSYVFTSVMAINVNQDEANVKTYLTGATSNIYVSQDNIYLSYTKNLPYRDYMRKYIDEVILPLMPDSEKEKVQNILNSNEEYWEKNREINELVYNYSSSLSGVEKETFDNALMNKSNEFEIKMSKENEKTLVHKIAVDNGQVAYVAVGEVPGHILNQFSMDEYAGKFRIATTTGQVWRTESNSLNHLYVLDEGMKVIGRVEDLAKGEKIYSARFMGERAYIVTFKKVDPLFVIDLSEPENPQVLGYLKITGFSDYLHPYDENHIIGIGKETRGGDEHFSWYQGLKISLFDVSDVANPKEVAKIEIGDRGTDSPALYDHKAVLFDKKRNLLVLPITLAEINRSQYSQYTGEDGSLPDSAYGQAVWQGAYVLNIDLSNISVRGRITHFDNESETNRYGWRFYDYRFQIQRSLFMDDTLYTISQSKIKANKLDTVEEIKKVDLPYIETYYGIMRE
jgi:uncharacterized secreted protein with C-terminal beta-propeller domain